MKDKSGNGNRADGFGGDLAAVGEVGAGDGRVGEVVDQVAAGPVAGGDLAEVGLVLGAEAEDVEGFLGGGDLHGVGPGAGDGDGAGGGLVGDGRGDAAA